MKPTKSRIDKWKAKHEAMLKLAGESEAVAEAKEIGKVEDDDEELMEDDEDHGHPAESGLAKSGSSANTNDHKAATASEADHHHHHQDEDEEDADPEPPELPNIDPDKGLMINLGGGSDDASDKREKKSNGPGAATRQQVKQALSV